MVSINRMASAPRFPQNRGAFPNRAEKSGPRETRALPADRKKACASARRTADNRFAYDGKGGCPCQDTHGSTDQFQVHSPSIRRGIKQQFGANIAFQTNIPNKKQPIRLKHCYLLHFFSTFLQPLGRNRHFCHPQRKIPCAGTTCTRESKHIFCRFVDSYARAQGGDHPVQLQRRVGRLLQPKQQPFCSAGLDLGHQLGHLPRHALCVRPALRHLSGRPTCGDQRPDAVAGPQRQQPGFAQTAGGSGTLPGRFGLRLSETSLHAHRRHAGQRRDADDALRPVCRQDHPPPRRRS